VYTGYNHCKVEKDFEKVLQVQLNREKKDSHAKIILQATEVADLYRKPSTITYDTHRGDMQLRRAATSLEDGTYCYVSGKVGEQYINDTPYNNQHVEPVPRIGKVTLRVKLHDRVQIKNSLIQSEQSALLASHPTKLIALAV